LIDVEPIPEKIQFRVRFKDHIPKEAFKHDFINDQFKALFFDEEGKVQEALIEGYFKAHIEYILYCISENSFIKNYYSYFNLNTKSIFEQKPKQKYRIELFLEDKNIKHEKIPYIIKKKYLSKKKDIDNVLMTLSFLTVSSSKLNDEKKIFINTFYGLSLYLSKEVINAFSSLKKSDIPDFISKLICDIREFE
jgi:hypothetical protein